MINSIFCKSKLIFIFLNLKKKIKIEKNKTIDIAACPTIVAKGSKSKGRNLMSNLLNFVNISFFN